MTAYLGVDPGARGAAVCVSDNGVEELRFAKTTEADIVEWFAALAARRGKGLPYLHAAVERVQATPKDMGGKVAAFKLGRSYGFLRAAMLAAGIRFVEVGAAQWQRAVGGPKPRGESYADRKRRLKGRAQQLYPGEKVVADNADAFLLAEYARQTAL